MEKSLIVLNYFSYERLSSFLPKLRQNWFILKLNCWTICFFVSSTQAPCNHERPLKLLSDFHRMFIWKHNFFKFLEKFYIENIVQRTTLPFTVFNYLHFETFFLLVEKSGLLMFVVPIVASWFKKTQLWFTVRKSIRLRLESSSTILRRKLLLYID